MRIDRAVARRGFVLGLGVLCLAVGCGSGGRRSTSGAPVLVRLPATRAELRQGRELFQGIAGGEFSCGFCHTLRSAATSSVVAESLDAEFSSDRASGWTDRRVMRDVLTYIEYGICRDPNDASRCMPRRLYTGGAAATVAAFLATCAARAQRPGCEPVGGLRGEALKGERDFTTLGCVGCHWASQGAKPIGPPLVGVYGSKVPLANGTTVKADTRYLMRSILEPDADTVKGYPYGFMRARITPGEISRAQARAIVAYIEALKRLPVFTQTG
jgi:cytochrome c2